ncbi:hypothetical protein KW798_01035 [Candidatus Parcubacteria bacterium]|nr:hypothetical protein [Candidatus Parcubacteria bacterium]
MNDFFEQLKKGGEIRMSDAEKAHMRQFLLKKISGAQTKSTASPYFSFFTMSTFLSVRSFAALVLVFLVVGSSTAYAAQGSLPGDLLYPVKIGVTEQVELALATTPQAKIDTEVRLADRRVSEAQTLDKEGRLDATTSAKIEAEFDKHVSHALALADEVPDEPNETPADVAAEPTTTALATEVASDTATSSDSASGTVEVATTVALKVAVLAPQATDTTTTTEPEAPKATSTATTTRRFSNSKKEGLMISLETKRETLRELRARYQTRGEVKGTETDRSDQDQDKNKGKGKDED